MAFGKIKYILVLSAAAFIAAAFADENTFQYEPHGRRDPFIPLIGQERSSVTRLEDITSVEDIKLEGIAVGAKGGKMAVLNGEILKENDKMGDVELKRISKKEVTITMGGKDYTIKLPEEGGAKSE